MLQKKIGGFKGYIPLYPKDEEYLDITYEVFSNFYELVKKDLNS